MSNRWCGRYKIVKQDDLTYRIYKRVGKRWFDIGEQYLIYSDAKRHISTLQGAKR